MRFAPGAQPKNGKSVAVVAIAGRIRGCVAGGSYSFDGCPYLVHHHSIVSSLSLRCRFGLGTLVINDIILGRFWIDLSVDVVIKNTKTGEGQQGLGLERAHVHPGCFSTVQGMSTMAKASSFRCPDLRYVALRWPAICLIFVCASSTENPSAQGSTPAWSSSHAGGTSRSGASATAWCTTRRGRRCVD